MNVCDVVQERRKLGVGYFLRCYSVTLKSLVWDSDTQIQV